MSSTRDRILETALDLFSQYGYSGVSIRDICGYVNIKESSLYYHFTNKQAILDEIINKFEANASLLMARLEKSLSISFDYCKGKITLRNMNCSYIIAGGKGLV